ncbi:unnamed protein product [Ilex paraguariensis]|uniref:Phospholipase A1 n=1 Tax=Ilex paraguariensis TaxID=185542 RepID=A0ABC8UF34_9AQUA
MKSEIEISGLPISGHDQGKLHICLGQGGYHGKGHRFVLASGRDIALVNKACDFLKDHHCVPPNWRQDENKGMVRSKDGRWIQPERPRLDDHPDDMNHHLKTLGLS